MKSIRLEMNEDNSNNTKEILNSIIILKTILKMLQTEHTQHDCIASYRLDSFFIYYKGSILSTLTLTKSVVTNY